MAANAAGGGNAAAGTNAATAASADTCRRCRTSMSHLPSRCDRSGAGTIPGVDLSSVVAMRKQLRGTGWLEAARGLATVLRRPTGGAGELLVVGTPDYEPWHLTAHLADAARFGVAEAAVPTLLRWKPEADAPAHLAVGVDRLAAAGRRETVFVVTPEAAPDALLERLDDARRHGAMLVALDGGDAALEDLAHEKLTVPMPVEKTPSGLLVAGAALPPLPFEVASHLVGAAVAEPDRPRRRLVPRRPR